MRGDFVNKVNLFVFFLNANFPLLIGKWGGWKWAVAVSISLLLLAVENWLRWRKGAGSGASVPFLVAQAGVLLGQWRWLS